MFKKKKKAAPEILLLIAINKSPSSFLSCKPYTQYNFFGAELLLSGTRQFRDTEKERMHKQNCFPQVSKYQV